MQRIFDQKPAAIVDALFGIGLSRDIGGIYAEAIESANNCTAIKIAVDIPSGINADTGAVMGAAFKADITITFQTAKRGHLLFSGREYAGELVISKIGEAVKGYSYESDEYLLEEADLTKLLPERKANSHKGNYGKRF